MKLNASEIYSISTGLDRIEDCGQYLLFHRFKQETEDLYKGYNHDFYLKTKSCAGAKLCFETDSENLFVDITCSKDATQTRTYFSFDVFVDSQFLDSLDNISQTEFPQYYAQTSFPLGDYSKNFYLGKGKKTVTVYLPWSVLVMFKEISIDDGSFFTPVKSEKTILCLGDSITQGYDALHSSNRYTAILSNLLGCDETNLAIGGEVFFPKLAEHCKDIKADYITVAYGTNDWSKVSRESFEKNCQEFYDILATSHKNSKIFAISPIWRADMDLEKPCGKFESIACFIKDVVSRYPNITFIEGFDFVEKDPKFFADARLHPNDEGFGQYAKHLYEKISAAL